MENKEKLEIVGLDKKPKYWDDRYMDGIEKMTPRKYEVLKEEDVLMQVRDGVTLAVDIYRPDTDEDTKFPMPGCVLSLWKVDSDDGSYIHAV